ncbi:hypothetical protein MMC30_003797 [Trapelia coarctata]|nr:hypothetical protein [Trapelia coarctata]
MPPSGDSWPQVGETKPLTILNDFHTDHSQTEEALLEFPLFPSFPTEIALAIWKCGLQRHRLISITVIDNDGNDSPPQSPPRGKNYRLSVTSNHRLSPLLRVSHESRQAVLEFYRVHIPCDFNTHGERRCLYLNPEFDFLYIKPEGAPEILVDVVHDVKAYDPLGFGILNMVVTDDIPYFRPNELKLPMNPFRLAPPALSVFTSTLTNLRRVFSQHIVRSDTRHLFDSLNMGEVGFNRSFPINSPTEAFDLIETDPRPIDADLEKVSIGKDPRSMLCQWQEMESKFQICRSRPVEFQFLITAPTYGQMENMKISTRADADKFLQFEEGRWHSKFEKGGIYAQFGYENPDTPESLKKAPMPVVGFWLFPVDAFGEVPKGKFEEIRWSLKELADLTKHRPQLGVFLLPHEE